MTDAVIDAPAPAPAATPAPAPSPAAATPAAPAPPPAAYPDDWRTQWSGGDEKALKRLERIESPAAMVKILRDQDLLIRNGKFDKPLKDGATPAEVAAWRTENGIPEKPEGYDTTMPDGLVFGEADKPGVDAYLQAMHGTNATPAQVKAGLQAFAEFRATDARAVAELDATESSAAEEALRKEWGGNYKGEIARIEALFANAPSGVRDLVMNSRAGRSGIMNNPDVVRWLAGVAREVNPTATVVPAGGSREGAIVDEIKQIEGMMYNEDGSNNKAYWGDKSVRERYGLLLQARDKGR